MNRVLRRPARDFSRAELEPHIRASYNTTDGPAGTLGAAVGATFTIYAFLEQSKLFDRDRHGSPAIFAMEWHPRAPLTPF